LISLLFKHYIEHFNLFFRVVVFPAHLLILIFIHDHVDVGHHSVVNFSIMNCYYFFFNILVSVFFFLFDVFYFLFLYHWWSDNFLHVWREVFILNPLPSSLCCCHFFSWFQHELVFSWKLSFNLKLIIVFIIVRYFTTILI